MLVSMVVNFGGLRFVISFFFFFLWRRVENREDVGGGFVFLLINHLNSG
jgi:hypothetical protein